MPLSQRSGILEWCDNTIVMKDYLTGENNDSGAHKRYHPSDLVATECRKKLAEAQKPEKKGDLCKVRVL